MNKVQQTCTGPELVPDALTGLRVFKAAGDYRLVGQYRDYVWDEAEITALCRREPPPPETDMFFATDMAVIVTGHNGKGRNEVRVTQGKIKSCEFTYTASFSAQAMNVTAEILDARLTVSAVDPKATNFTVTTPVPGRGGYARVAAVPPTAPEPHDAPDADCTCGIYAYHDLEPVSLGFSRQIVAVVEATGRTLVGSKGFRASQARILAVTASHPDERALVARVAAQYGVECCSSLKELVEDFHTKRWCTPAS